MTVMRNMLRVWQRRSDLPIFAEALLWLGLAELALRLLPFRHVVLMLQPVLAEGAAPASPDALVGRVAWAVSAAARHAPWRAVCFHEAIAAQHLLARRRIAGDAHYGVARDEVGSLPAHVWVSVGDRVVVGESDQPYRLLTSFSAQIRPPEGL